MSTICRIKEEVKNLMGFEASGHGFDHVMRVYDIALDLCNKEKANEEVVALAALLHDADDYKMFGQDSADNLTNAKNIMSKFDIDKNKQVQVLDIIKNMGYSKAMKGVRPDTLEGQIVSDADMLDAMGVVGSLRTLAYTITKGSGKIFDKNVFPDENLTTEKYKVKNRREDNFINHHFDKLLKLKNMVFTSAGKEEACHRQKSMYELLYAFFREQKLNSWVKYLDDFEKNNK